MWESPIQMITGDIITDIVRKQDEWIMESVHRVGVNIDKDELVKALNYDRDQYEKGFSDGRMARDSEIVRCFECKFYMGNLDDQYLWNHVTDSVCEYWESDGLYPDDFCSYGERKETEDVETHNR